MFVIEVIPLRRAITVTSLTYYSRTDYAPGTILTVPIRGQSVSAIVLASQPASYSKTALRSATFTLRKLPAQNDPGTVPDLFITVARSLTQHYPATTGALLYALLPTDITDGTYRYEHSNLTVHTEDTTPQTIQANRDDRFTLYQSHVRSVLGRGGSVLCVVPTAADVTATAARLGTGIADRVVELSPHATKKARSKNWDHIKSATAPLLIVTTPQYALVDRNDITSMLVEQSGSGQYSQRSRPFLDYRLVLEQLAIAAGRSIVFGDTVIRTEHEYRRRQDRFFSYDETPKRLLFPARLRILEHAERTDSKAPFPLFTAETIDRLYSTLNQRQNVFLYAARRGLAPLMVCFDCGTIVRCHESGNPYSLLRTHRNGEEQRWFVDTTSGKRVRAADTCEHCGSWRLRERGIGIQHIADTLPELFPDVPVVTFDSTTATTPKKARDLATAASELKGGIVLGTALALPYLPSSIAVSCVTSLEAAQSIPSWRADEMFFRLLLELREKSSREVILQTRSGVTDVIKHAERGAIEQFYTEEIALREMLSYPPFATLILLHWTGDQETVQALEEQVQNTLTDYPPHCYSHPHSQPRKIKRYALLRIPSQDWPHEATRTALQQLPPSITIEINPDRIV